MRGLWRDAVLGTPARAGLAALLSVPAAGHSLGSGVAPAGLTVCEAAAEAPGEMASVCEQTSQALGLVLRAAEASGAAVAAGSVALPSGSQTALLEPLAMCEAAALNENRQAELKVRKTSMNISQRNLLS